MRTSITIATFLVAGLGAAGVSALPNPYEGSDTLFKVTRAAIVADDTGTNYFGNLIGTTVELQYVGGGSGNADSNMSKNYAQLAGPMSRMMTNESNVCTAANAPSAQQASGIVIGLDGVDIYASNASTNTTASGGTGGSATCNGTADGQGNGLIYSSTPGIFHLLVCSDGTGSTSASSLSCQAPGAILGQACGVSPNTCVAESAANPSGLGVNTAQTWKWALALLYGGKDYSISGGSPNGAPDCSQTSRQTLVNNWSSLFQLGCINGSSACTAFVCSDGSAAGLQTCNANPAPGIGAACGTGGTCAANTAGTPGAILSGLNGGGLAGLWHAFRRDDTSGTSDVFATLLGLSPSTSSSKLNGFGASPYCNAMNWDVSTANGGATGNCTAGPGNQFTGPGGINLTVGSLVGGVAVTAGHKKPPTGTWGDNPNGSGTTITAWDVLPTQMQDNDPIRRPCINGVAGNDLKAGEEVCNLDGQLGLVIPMVDSDWVVLTDNLLQYPSAICAGNFITGTAPTVFKCATNNHTHQGECPNGDAIFGSGCLLPTAATTSQCLNKSGNVAALTTSPLCTAIGQTGCVTQLHFPVATAINPGLVYNLGLRSGGVVDNGKVSFLQYPVPAISATAGLDFLGAFNRIHQTETVLGGAGGSPLAAGCQLLDMTDQIACLAQADPCSVGYAGDSGKLFANNPADPNNGPGPAGAVDSMRIAQVYPQASTVQLLGKVGEYQVARKLYFNTLFGWNAVSAGGVCSDGSAAGAVTCGTSGSTTGTPCGSGTCLSASPVPAAGDHDEFTLAKFESGDPGSTINTVLTSNGEFTLGTQFGGAPDPQFCEDFNEVAVCAAVGPNNNGCVANPAGVPGGLAGVVGSNTGVVSGPGSTQAASTSTICGDGVRQAYEECDLGAANGTPGPGGCSTTCRCLNDFVSGNCI